MLKQEITYDDYDGNSVTETYHFHASQEDLMSTEGLYELLMAWIEKFPEDSDATELSVPDIRNMLTIIKLLIRVSYGVRNSSNDFDQSDEIFAAFKRSAGYDAFIMRLFENPEEAVAFMNGILPKAVMEQAKAEIEQRGGVVDVALPEKTPSDPREMSREELEAAFKLKMQSPAGE